MPKAPRIAAIAFGTSLLSLLAWEAIDPQYIPESQILGPKTDLETLERGLASFSRRHGHPPTATEGLAALISDRQLERIPMDPWSHSYILVATTQAPGFKVYSAGKNGVDELGTGDDIVASDKSYSCTDYREFCVGAQVPEYARFALMLLALLGTAVASVASIWATWRRIRGHESAA